MSSHESVPVGYGNLIVTRKQSESITVGDGLVQIKVLEIRGSRVRLAVSCPREMKVVRTELEEGKS